MVYLMRITKLCLGASCNFPKNSTLMNRQEHSDNYTPWHITLLDLSEYDQSNRAKHHSREHPSWETVREAILALDGNRQSDLVIEAANGETMCIGGGQGRYVVSTQPDPTSDTGNAAILVNPLYAEDIVLGGLVVGGTETDISEHFVVELSMVFQAAEQFFNDGTLDPSLHWELE
jgi:hypothetical protein